MIFWKRTWKYKYISLRKFFLICNVDTGRVSQGGSSSFTSSDHRCLFEVSHQTFPQVSQCHSKHTIVTFQPHRSLGCVKYHLNQKHYLA